MVCSFFSCCVTKKYFTLLNEHHSQQVYEQWTIHDSRRHKNSMRERNIDITQKLIKIEIQKCVFEAQVTRSLERCKQKSAMDTICNIRTRVITQIIRTTSVQHSNRRLWTWHIEHDNNNTLPSKIVLVPSCNNRETIESVIMIIKAIETTWER